MKGTRKLYAGVAGVGLLVALGVGQHWLETAAAAAQAGGAKQAPRFEVDPLWPKPFPNHWLLGNTIGVSVDSRNHVWIIHRSSASLGNNEKGMELQPPTSSHCCKGAPPVIEFDPAGTVVGSWGGPVAGAPYDWPESNHGITVETNGTVWIGGNGPADGLVLKFTREGKFIKQFGKKGVKADSNATDHFFQVAKIFVDEKGGEAYISDGYGNKRVAVLDKETGAFKRYWGAYGNKPSDENLGRYNPTAPLVQQFRNPVHCAELSVDNIVYVCDRVNDRIQTFSKEGKFIKEVQIEKDSLADGSVWDIVFSKEPQQRFLYLADGRNQKLHILDRQSLEVLTSFGEGGRQVGQWYGLHSLAVDSAGNLYTTETYEGKRIQKFVFKGIGPVTARYQGTVRPTGTR
jgi:hypothetical protein